MKNFFKYVLGDLWLIIKIVKDFYFGLKVIDGDRTYVTVFGSARFKPGHEYYKLAEKVGKLIAESGFPVMTGGGPGVMEASSKGAKSVKGKTLGCNIKLPFEQKPNPYLDRVTSFHYFFARKFVLNEYARAFIFLPGGFGTLDEFAEAITLIQTKKIKKRPIVMVGTEYWKGFREFIDSMISAGTVSSEDTNTIIYTDDLEVVRSIIHQTKLVR